MRRRSPVYSSSSTGIPVARVPRGMRIGVAREIKTDEYRVALTPAGARELVLKGHEVLVETTAGDGSSFADADYERVGAQIVSVDDVVGPRGDAPEGEGADRAGVQAAARRARPVHVPPHRRGRAADACARRQRHRGGRLRDGRDGRPAAAAARADERDRRPARRRRPARTSSRSRSAAAGCCSAACPGVAPGRVAVLGGGIVGYNAAIIALGLGAQVTILERSIDRMRYLDEILSGRVSLVMSSTPAGRGVDRPRPTRHRRRAHPGRARAEARDARDARRDEAGRGRSSTSRSTRAAASRPRSRRRIRIRCTTVDGDHHYCVANMPGGVPITSTKALTNATLPYVEAIAEHGLARAVAQRPGAGPRRQRPRREDHVRGGRRGARPRVHAARGRPAPHRGLTAQESALGLRRRVGLLRRRELHDHPRDACGQADRRSDDEDDEGE